MAELALNNKILATTGQTLFFVNFERHPNIFITPKDLPKVQ